MTIYELTLSQGDLILYLKDFVKKKKQQQSWKTLSICKPQTFQLCKAAKESDLLNCETPQHKYLERRL